MGDRVAHLCVPHILDARRHIADHARRQFLAGDELPRAEVADLDHLELCAGRHHQHLVTGTQPPVPDTAKHNDPPVRIVKGIENQCRKRRIHISCRCRQLGNDLLQDFSDIFSCLR